MRTQLQTPRTIAGLALLLAIALATGLMGCPAQGDIGAPCRLVKANPDGGSPVPILVGEVNTSQDIISFASLECSEFICIHSRNSAVGDAGSELSGNCSEKCTPGAPGACQGLVDRSLAGQYTCRSLVLDVESLQAICASDPSSWTCTIQNSAFCAQGAQDAGP